MDPVAAQNGSSLSFELSLGGALQDPLEFRIEDILADQPAPIVGESG